MAIAYKPVVIIIDDFTTKSSGYSNTTFYDSGYLNVLRTHDFYTDSYGYIDGYGDVDYSEYLYVDDTLQFYQAPSAYGYDLTLDGSGSYLDIYNNTAYYYDYLEWDADNTSLDTIQHGDWVLDAFRNQLDDSNSTEVILIDLDTSAGYVNQYQSYSLFSIVQSTYSGLYMTTLEGVIEEWLVQNNTDNIQYLPIALSYSIAGPMPTENENYALDMLSEYFTTVVQAVPNVTQGGYVWGDTYKDVINVGAYNLDSNGYSLHGNPNNPSVIDILANGYVEHSGWDAGYNFGTSFATPRVAAEITNMWVDFLGELNVKLSSGEITQDDINNIDSDLSYSSYIELLLQDISSEVFIELVDGWLDTPVSVLSDDVEDSPLPIQVAQLSSGLSQYHVTDAAYYLLLSGTTGDDTIEGGFYADKITSLGGTNIISALAGNDIINLSTNSTWSSGYIAKNVSNNKSIGTSEKIDLVGLNRFSDVIDGGADIDILNLTTGSDAFFIDDVYSNHHNSLILSSTTQGVDSIARIASLEVINAGIGDDIVDLTSANFILANAIEINGEAGDDILWGSNSNDTINGGKGDDTIFGGSGNDILTGGVGADMFQFTATSENNVINDFDVANDSIKFYYRAEDNHTNADLNLINGIITWDVDNTNKDVMVDLSATLTSVTLSELDSLIVFVDIV